MVCTVETLNASGITDTYELYNHIHPSGVGAAEVQNDILQETFINTTAGWVNLLLLSSSGLNGRPHTCKLYSSMPIFMIKLEPWRLRGAQILQHGRPQGATPVAHSVTLSQLDKATPDSTHEYRWHLLNNFDLAPSNRKLTTMSHQ
ncbi:hypothetical protein BYT27DRAFT_7261965 [Phlegmacium glaucopus]|nr:hypothetical protein BYT27DRAFT_7261965 [Phlegmacium glaucopus]